MIKNNTYMPLPDHQTFNESIKALTLPISTSKLHGIMCAYLAVGANQGGEAYLQAIMPQKKDKASRVTILSLFNIYAITQQQIAHFGFKFQLLLPDANQSLLSRAQAFSEWCVGFTQGLSLSGFNIQHLKNESTREMILHIAEFGQLDYQMLEVNEDDARAFMYATEYTRMAVPEIYADIHLQQGHTGPKSVH